MYGAIISYRTPVPAFGWKFWLRFTNYSWLQNTFTNMPETHCAIYVGSLHRQEKEMVYDAHYSVRFGTLSFNEERNTLFLIGAEDKELKPVIDSLIEDYEETIYGFFQLPYFILRWMFGWLFDVRRWWFPFKKGKICSELVWEYLYRIAKKKRWLDLMDELNKWKPDNVHAGDIRQIINKFENKYFTKIKGVQ